MSHFDQLKKEIRARDKVLLRDALEKRQYHVAFHMIISRSKILQKRIEQVLLFGQTNYTTEEDLKVAIWAMRYLRRLTKARGAK